MASVRCSFVTGLRFGGNGGGETQRRCFPGTKNFFACGGYNSSAVFLPQNHAFTYNDTYYQQVFGTGLPSLLLAVRIVKKGAKLAILNFGKSSPVQGFSVTRVLLDNGTVFN